MIEFSLFSIKKKDFDVFHPYDTIDWFEMKIFNLYLLKIIRPETVDRFFDFDVLFNLKY